MSIKDLAPLVGKTGLVDFDGLTVLVTVTDARESYGRAQVEVTAGYDSRWIDAARLKADIPATVNATVVRDWMEALGSAGYAVVVWTPNEIGEASIDRLQEIVIERGNDFLEGWS